MIPRVIVRPLQEFLGTEAAGGVFLLVAAVVAVVWANSPWRDGYEALWSAEVAVGIGRFAIHEDLRQIVNDGGMALFFFVVGLEIKRELVHGDLRQPRTALLPAAAAVGGMVVPALLYLAVNASGAGAAGWGIPMATDIAFSVGVLTLMGRRVPVALKAFLLALAIVDDIGAIVVIAVFYSSGISVGWLALAVAGLAVVAALRWLGVRSLVAYTVLAGGVWLAMLESGVHATLAGVALGLLTPAVPFQRPSTVRWAVTQRLGRPPAGAPDGDAGVDSDEEIEEAAFLDVAALSRDAVSPLARLEHALHPWSAWLVLPLFALANAGVALTGLPTGDGARVAGGVMLGLVVGKPVGIFLGAALAARLLGAALPRDVTWGSVAAVGLLGGIGFTVSLFIAGLAFAGPLVDAAKIGILASSLLAGVIGAGVVALRRAAPS